MSPLAGSLARRTTRFALLLIFVSILSTTGVFRNGRYIANTIQGAAVSVAIGDGLWTGELLISLLTPLAPSIAHAQQPSLRVTLTVSPLSGQAPFTPAYHFNVEFLTTEAGSGPVRIMIYWGDGSFTDVSSCSYNCPRHIYTAAGAYTIRIAVTDIAGVTSSDTKTITVY